MKQAGFYSVSYLRWILFHTGLLVRLARESKRSVILMFHGVPKGGAEEFH